MHIVYNRVVGVVLFILFVIWMSTPSLVVFVRNWWRKRSVWMHNEHMELRSETGIKRIKPRQENTSKRVKST